jgi:hypothetical protein
MADFVQERRDLVARCLLQALARRERAGRAPQRLLEPGLATWEQLRGNLRLQHLLALLVEDTAVRFPLPADLRRVLGAEVDLTRLSDAVVYSWISALSPEVLDAPRAEALTAYGRLLGLPTRFAGADLRKLQAETRVLELPGTGGQLVARALERSPEAWLHVNTTVLTASWADRAMAGLVAMECDAPGVDFVVDDPELAWATEPEQRNRYDFVFGLQPEKGGQHTEAALTSRFPTAILVLV